ncbi:hypothetical protein B0F90DRAFT_1735852 [Multifurca ochricompacta]|uniref:Uncharacterized protein n=1 Tax=Multifurca ochricompacta TaxID=376703 RepID=A0AAD4QM37_9AGAM|nr:hypothetical protein B0F90DRAFT_1735852 [Multifurca ochricompacta]
MAHYDIFREQLAIKYPAYGHALWEPSPGELYCPVEVGDVGYIREGRFHRLFNALLPAKHQSHQTFGVPEYHEPLKPNTSKHIDSSTLRPNDFCSAGVVASDEPDCRALGPDDYSEISFSCTRKRGAVLSLPVLARREDTVARGVFGKWIVKHIDSWFAWARQLGLGIDRMEDIILVTGHHRARSWANVAFYESPPDARISFGVEVTSDPGTRIKWKFSRKRTQGAVFHWGPEGEVRWCVLC